MIKSSYLPHFLYLIKTSAYADEIIDRLDELKASLYNKRVNIDKKISELFPSEMKEKIMIFSWQEQVNLHDPEAFGKFLTSLQDAIRQMPQIKIYVAVEPTSEIIDMISSWFIENYGKGVLIEPVVDEDLVAGALIEYEGGKYDFSLRKRIGEKITPKMWKEMILKARQKKPEEKEQDFTPLNIDRFLKEGVESWRDFVGPAG